MLVHEKCPKGDQDNSDVKHSNPMNTRRLKIFRPHKPIDCYRIAKDGLNRDGNNPKLRLVNPCRFYIFYFFQSFLAEMDKESRAIRIVSIPRTGETQSIERTGNSGPPALRTSRRPKGQRSNLQTRARWPKSLNGFSSTFPHFC